MVLRVPETPEHAREAVRAVLATPRRRTAPPPDSVFAGPSGSPDAEADDADPDVPGPTPVCPHRMFEIDLADLAAGRGVEAARPVGWRWLIHERGRTVGAVEVAEPVGGPPLARFTEGPFTTGTDAAVATVRSLPHVERGYYELRLLHIPGLYTVALWLADLVGWQDLLVPLAPAPPGVQALRPYPAAELAHTLVARGAHVLTTTQA